MSAKRLVIPGRVQGVGYRQWMVDTARSLGVSGWVRNRLDGSVEALVAGETPAVEELLRACRRGPRLADVAQIEEQLAEPPEQMGFHHLPNGVTFVGRGRSAAVLGARCSSSPVRSRQLNTSCGSSRASATSSTKEAMSSGMLPATNRCEM